MLHRLEIANFHSIGDPQVIDLRAAGNAPDDPYRLAPLWPGATERATKVVALFGANASGKSNVLKAVSFVAWFLGQSFRADPEAPLPYEPFRSDEGRTAPTRLAVWFAGPVDVMRAAEPDLPACRYAYELVVQAPPDRFDSQRVVREVLRYWPRGAGRSVSLFERCEGAPPTAAKAFGLAGYRPALEKVLRPSASALGTLAQLQHPLGQHLQRQAALVLTNLFFQKQELRVKELAVPYAKHPHLLEQLNREIERLSLGIRGMELLPSISGGPTALFTHHGLRELFPASVESHGTLQFVHLFPLLALALEHGGVAAIDELDSALHPMILAEIVRWFHDRERNPKHAQLWMTCQNAALMDDLTKEQVFFCEKDDQGRTSVYGLSDIRGVRRSENHAGKYLGGVYGAVPNVG